MTTPTLQPVAPLPVEANQTRLTQADFHYPLLGRGLAAATIRRKLAALFDYLCEKNAVLYNPVRGVSRPKEGANEGKTPALSDDQAAAGGTTLAHPRQGR